jgi:hypothetical protein
MDYDRDSRPDPVDHCDVCDNEFEAVACRHCITYRDDLIEQARANLKALREAAAALIAALPRCYHCDEPRVAWTRGLPVCAAHHDDKDEPEFTDAAPLRALQAVLK